MQLRALAVLLVSLAVACGPKPAAAPAEKSVTSTTTQSSSGQPTTLADIANYRGQDRETVLYNGAKQEGTLVWYTTLAGDILSDLKSGFQAKYPGVQVQEFRMTSAGEQTNRIIEEYKANTFKPDIYEATVANAQQLLEAGYVLPYWSPTLASYPDNARNKAKDDLVYWTFERQSFIGFGYNTNLISPDAVPKTWKDLANPALKGKIALSGTDTGPRAIAAMVKANNEDFVKQSFWPQSYAIQEVSGRALLDLIINGEIASSPTIYRNHVLDSKAQGAPIEWVPLNPVPTNTGSVAIMTRAPHPYAATLWADYVLGPDGQALFEKREYGSPTKSYGFDVYYPEAGLSLDQYDKALKNWSDLMRQGAGKS